MLANSADPDDFIWVYTVCQSTILGFPVYKALNRRLHQSVHYDKKNFYKIRKLQ